MTAARAAARAAAAGVTRCIAFFALSLAVLAGAAPRPAGGVRVTGLAEVSLAAARWAAWAAWCVTEADDTDFRARAGKTSTATSPAGVVGVAPDALAAEKAACASAGAVVTPVPESVRGADPSSAGLRRGASLACHALGAASSGRVSGLTDPLAVAAAVAFAAGRRVTADVGLACCDEDKERGDGAAGGQEVLG